MNGSGFYLKFVEGLAREEPRFCMPIRRLTLNGYGNVALVVKVTPPCSGRRYGPTDADVNYLVLSPMFSHQSLFPVSKWPEDVYVFAPHVENPELRDSLALEEVKKIAFGEIHHDVPS